jgi:hypothetical protein
MEFIKLAITIVLVLGRTGEDRPKVAALNKSKAPAVISTGMDADKVLAGDIAHAMRTHWRPHWAKRLHYDRYARLFVKNARRWKVDPVLVACVAYAESRYQPRPVMWAKRCKWISGASRCNKPGPCYRFDWKYKKVCKSVKVNKDESGMMQVLYYDGSTRKGYKLCTGKRLRGKRGQRRRALMPVKVSICVGTYELAKWKKWARYGGWGRIRCRRRGHRTKYCPLRLQPRAKRNRAFFTKWPKLKRHFWVAFYNWGSNFWKGNFYPRYIAGCYHRYTKSIRKRRASRGR